MSGEYASVDAKGGTIRDYDDVTVLEPKVGIRTGDMLRASVVGFSVGRRRGWSDECLAYQSAHSH